MFVTSLFFPDNEASNFEYSNCGPVVLGLIIEAVSGQDYFDYIRAHVYAPAGMQHSDHYNKVETDSGKAIGYFVPPKAGATKLTFRLSG